MIEGKIRKSKALSDDKKEKLLEKSRDITVEIFKETLELAKKNGYESDIITDLEHIIHQKYAEIEKATRLTETSVKKAFSVGVRFLKRQQRDDGGWGFHSEQGSNTWDTASTLIALIHAGEHQSSKVIGGGAEWLMNSKNRNLKGLWSDRWKTYGDTLYVYDTSLAIISLLRAGITLESPIIQNAVNALKNSQSPYGGWHPQPWISEIDTGATSLAIVALLEARESPLTNKINRGIKWLKNNQKDDGGWGRYWKRNSNHSIITKTHDAVIALIRAGESPTSNTIKNAINWIGNSQRIIKDEEGDWGWGWEEYTVCPPRYTYSITENTATAIITLLEANISLTDNMITSGIRWLINEEKWGWNTPRVVSCLSKYLALRKSKHQVLK